MERIIYLTSDCKVVIDDILSSSMGRHGAVVKEIKRRSTGFDSCVFLHECRNFNFEAHNLAKFALSLGPGRHVRLGTPYNADIVPVNIYANE